MTDYIVNALADIPVFGQVFLLSMIPVTELRAAIPIGIVLDMTPWQAFFWGVLGNLVPIVPLLLFLPWVYRLVCKIPFLESFLTRFVERCRRKGHQVEKYGALGLLFFVAVPLPGTGVWTGWFIAFLMGINFYYATIAISMGAILAGLTVTLASVGVKTMFLSNVLFKLELLGFIFIVAILTWWGYKWWKREQGKK